MLDGFTRREVLGGLAAGGATLLAEQFHYSWAQNADASESQMATGVVFNDSNGNGVCDPGEAGIPDVLVSNGSDVVRTDSQGRYRLPVRDGTMLFVIKPANWKVPVNGQNLPRFYYYHRPNGSPVWRAEGVPGVEKLEPKWYYGGVKPTGPLPASIDFPLVRSPEPETFKMVVFGDTQVTHEQQLEWMARDTVAELVNRKDVAFGISLGDVVNVGLLHMFEPVNQVQAATGFPWYSIPGNHDQNLVVPNDDLGAETFRSIYGPTTYAFEYGPVSFLMLDNVRRGAFAKLENPDLPAGKAKPYPSAYWCGLRDEHWQFVENYLKTISLDRQLVICMHIPVTGRTNEEKAFAKRFLSVIGGRKHTLSISGHSHVQQHAFLGAADGFAGPGEHHHFNSICVRGPGYRGMFDELRIPGCMAFDGTPNGYSFITFNATGYKIRYKASRGPDDYQVNVFVSPRIDKAAVGKEIVRANVFAGSPRSIVLMRVNDGPWMPMQLKPQPDPAMQWVIANQDTAHPWLGSKYGGKNVKVPNSQHIWQASLPDGLKEGTYTLQIKATDIHGQTDTASTFFKVMSGVAEDPTREDLAMMENDFPEYS